MAFKLIAWLSHAILTSGTDTPPPGPRCGPGTPIENQSGLVPVCESKLVHNATCTTEGGGENWTVRPQFHVGSLCHGENDPNGLVYYKGVYHLFVQDHVGGGTVGGHFASRDFVNWKRLPVGLWNDRWYDKSGVWTFSATVVDGVPVMVYPGIAQPNNTLGNCGNLCFTHNVALPADPSDPWLMDWVKPDYNPIIMGTQRDPTSAWRTAAGEWRYTSLTKDIYSSWDFKTWKIVGNMDGFGGGECPDFFPLPRDCDGCTGGSQPRPTHVHAVVTYMLGTYEDGAPNTTGNWTPLVEGIKFDGHGPLNFYAGKTFYDPVKQRRILWGWIRLTERNFEPNIGFRGGQCPGFGTVMTNTNSLPRELRYDPLLQRLVSFPIEETEKLRGKALVHMQGQDISGPVKVPIPSGQERQSEIRISFAMPAEKQRLSVFVLPGAYENGTRFGVELFIDFLPNAQGNETWTVKAGHDSNSMWCPLTQRKQPLTHVPCGGATLDLPLKKSDKTLDVAIWVDNIFMEVYFMGGRSVWTIPFPCTALSLGRGVEVSSSSNAHLSDVTAWAMNPLQYENVGPAPSVTNSIVI